jgi:hypothetical protein
MSLISWAFLPVEVLAVLAEAAFLAAAAVMAAGALWRGLRYRPARMFRRGRPDEFGAMIAAEMKRDMEPPATREEAAAFAAYLRAQLGRP